MCCVVLLISEIKVFSTWLGYLQLKQQKEKGKFFSNKIVSHSGSRRGGGEAGEKRYKFGAIKINPKEKVPFLQTFHWPPSPIVINNKNLLWLSPSLNVWNFFSILLSLLLLFFLSTPPPVHTSITIH